MIDTPDAPLFYVEIVKQDTGEVVKRMGPFHTERSAERIERGVMMNMNHEDYFTRVVKAEAK